MKVRLYLCAVLAALCMVAIPHATRADQKLDRVIQLTMQANKEGAASQRRVDKLHDETQDMLTEYRTVQQQIDSLKVYNAQLEALIQSQEREMVDIQRQIDGVVVVQREITPLMMRMIDALDQFVQLDVPFLLDERTKRVQKLKDIMGRADVSESEKYRQIMEAFQVENDYGRTIETYQASLPGDDRTLNFLRIGRVILIYQTLDGREAAVWNQDTRMWEKLPSSYRNEISKGLRMARKQAAPDLLRLPVPAPKEASR